MFNNISIIYNLSQTVPVLGSYSILQLSRPRFIVLAEKKTRNFRTILFSVTLIFVSYSGS